MRWILCYVFLYFVSPNLYAEVDTEWNLRSLYQYQWHSFDNNRDNNPDNTILRFVDRSQLVELQPDFTLKSDGFEINLQPRFSQTNDYGDAYGNDDSKSTIRYWSFGYQFADYQLKAGRYVNLWGPARLVSPSNRYHLNTGQANPNLELRAREYVEFGGDLGSRWRYLLTVNYNDGEQNLADFKVTEDIQLTWTGGDISATFVLSKPELGAAVGGYGQWTASDALILYTDFLYRTKSLNQSEQLLDQVPVETRALLSAITGISYTFEGGLNIAIDYLYNQAGLTSISEQEMFDQSNLYTRALLQGDQNREKFAYVSKVNRLPFYQLSQHYLFTMLQKNNFFDDFNINCLSLLNIDDNSQQYSVTLDYHKFDSVNIYSSINYFKGNQDSEFGRFYNGQYSIGFRYVF
jgi:hypothetical protein